MSRWTAAATALYVLWGVLHLGLGVTMMADGLSAESPRGEAQAEALMFFLCATLLGAQAIAVALTMNRLNSRRGHWLNLLTLGTVDAAFLMVMVLPGHVDVIGGLSGPAIWLLAATASTLALRRAPATA
ncbi:hypothetical protein GCM10009678_36340 [Actinomadura kijaniata]|uniref:Uncharacterized membrane protein HdeD (DUF308 family) n=1 Tax=Actinomadura namibiensis TaxID=182080 RepID=A0A7W3LQ07_ACTNM|nr:hypothetical protein [Actinomadura namibiensis]MBA8952190.1 uncharacterized membrane protein HdeD (DUF308 family) [Actinomadura namibiensis]